MKSVVLGKVIENYFSVITGQETIVDEYGEEKVVYAKKPVLMKNPKLKEWKEICSFEGAPRYNRSNIMWKSFYSSNNYNLNITEDEEVAVEKEIFRADLNELHLQTNKVLDEIDVDKQESTYEYNRHIALFNEEMIKSNKLMQDYCDLHGLDCQKADCEKVFALVYPNKEYEIKDGKMVCKEKVVATILSNHWCAIEALSTTTDIAISADLMTTVNDYVTATSDSIV